MASATSATCCFRNARIVLADQIVSGSLSVRAGLIDAIDVGGCEPLSALDVENDYLIPGMVELHTDNLEKHIRPRPGVHWPPLSAVTAHDRQLVASGITTVLDAMAAGDIHEGSARVLYFREMIDSLAYADAHRMLNADHHLHIRCELSHERVLDLFSLYVDDERVRLVSTMDHTPGQRQYADVAVYRTYYQGKYGLDDATIDRMIEHQWNNHLTLSACHRQVIVEACRHRGLAMASHDDAEPGHIDQAVAEGMVLAEFPTTRAAAARARERNLTVLMGAPNLVLGGSHSGNVSAAELAAAGLLDVLSSDYVPNSLLLGAFLLHCQAPGLPLPDAIRMVSATPAAQVGFVDRGEIAVGRRADLVRVREVSAGTPIILGVWREGRRIG